LSLAVTIRAAAVPSVPIAPVTTVIYNTGVKITWTAPYNGGDPITFYTVKILHSDNTTSSTELSNCDGSNLGIITAAQCTIPIISLLAAPFNLNWG
jgi:hypothetical protein